VFKEIKSITFMDWRLDTAGLFYLCNDNKVYSLLLSDVPKKQIILSDINKKTKLTKLV
jgi:hypothetical protein